MGHVGHEAALAGLSGLQIEHLRPEVLGHLVERSRQHPEFVGAHRQPDVQVALRHQDGGLARGANRSQQPPGQPVPGDGSEHGQDHCRR